MREDKLTSLGSLVHVGEGIPVSYLVRHYDIDSW